MFRGRRYPRVRPPRRSRNGIDGFPAVGIIMLLLISILSYTLYYQPSSVKINTDDLAALRIPPQNLVTLYNLSGQYNTNYYEALSVFLLKNQLFPNKAVDFSEETLQQYFFTDYSATKAQFKNKQIIAIQNIFEALFTEIKCFPIPLGYGSCEEGMYMYGDSWGDSRAYGGERTHQGCDIIDRDNIRGRIPILSMTSGYIENLGWNELGGWRVGIRTENSTYYYYAHLDTFAPGLLLGQSVEPGTLLGYMGDSGYSKTEDTKGKFVVHLHIGISPQTNLTSNEFWINPYPFLRIIESQKVEPKQKQPLP